MGFDVFSDWWAASEDADDWLRDYYKARGFNYKETLNSFAAQHIFEFDKRHLDRTDLGVMVMPAGKSGHLELGYLVGQGKPGYILFDREPERVDIMYNFATDVFFDFNELAKVLKDVE
jgi:nucleoside 2-deoxyribosyltransferase